MPELPEMQALAERIDTALSGAHLVAARPIAFSALKTFDPSPDSLAGRTLVRVWRRGKFLVFEFGEPRMLLHLSQGGRMDLEDPPKDSRPKNGVVRLLFDRAPALFVKEFGTERKAGWWVLAPNDDGPLAQLGPEPHSVEFEALILRGDDTRRIHTLLRDQRTVAGIGRGYTNDILHDARLSPYATLASLDDAQRRALLRATRSVLLAALDGERGRTGGLPPKLGARFIVHGKAGTPCPRCGEDLRRISYESHEVTYCPACQTGGKTLADRRMSRIVR